MFFVKAKICPSKIQCQYEGEMYSDRFIRPIKKDFLDIEDDDGDNSVLADAIKENRKYINAAQKEHNGKKYRNKWVPFKSSNIEHCWNFVLG